METAADDLLLSEQGIASGTEVCPFRMAHVLYPIKCLGKPTWLPDVETTLKHVAWLLKPLVPLGLQGQLPRKYFVNCARSMDLRTPGLAQPGQAIAFNTLIPKRTNSWAEMEKKRHFGQHWAS